ncbi:hypothetical protein B0T14DRAFT_528456 [Immersiella caudata]|uniref:Uncharacterized protein n=1 Tax=Immersiella caudata TaxID=314043 RepID=A0AA39WFF4_9PEZI|nr:hypothetical protein B0T14DRAFT_528456 [Immersiella caudata]
MRRSQFPVVLLWKLEWGARAGLQKSWRVHRTNMVVGIGAWHRQPSRRPKFFQPFAVRPPGVHLPPERGFSRPSTQSCAGRLQVTDASGPPWEGVRWRAGVARLHISAPAQVKQLPRRRYLHSQQHA